MPLVDMNATSDTTDSICVFGAVDVLMDSTGGLNIPKVIS